MWVPLSLTQQLIRAARGADVDTVVAGTRASGRAGLQGAARWGGAGRGGRWDSLPFGFDFTCLLVMDNGGGSLGLFLISEMTLHLRLSAKRSSEPPEPRFFRW